MYQDTSYEIDIIILSSHTPLSLPVTIVQTTREQSLLGMTLCCCCKEQALPRSTLHVVMGPPVLLDLESRGGRKWICAFLVYIQRRQRPRLRRLDRNWHALMTRSSPVLHSYPSALVRNVTLVIAKQVTLQDMHAVLYFRFEMKHARPEKPQSLQGQPHLCISIHVTLLHTRGRVRISGPSRTEVEGKLKLQSKALSTNLETKRNKHPSVGPGAVSARDNVAELSEHL